MTTGVAVWQHFSQAVSSRTTLLAIAAVFVVAGFLLAGRLCVHVEDHYWQYEPPPGVSWALWQKRALSGLTILDTVLAGALVGAGIFFLFHPARDTQFYMSAAFALLVATSSHTTLRLTNLAGLPRGSDTVRSCPLVRRLRANAELWGNFPGVKQLDRIIWVCRTPVGHVSGLIIVIVIALGASALADRLAEPSRPPRSTQTSHSSHGTRPKPARGAQTVGTRSGSTATMHNPVASVPEPPTANDGSDAPTYEDLCGTAVQPGQGAPPPQNLALAKAWFAIGGIIAACGGPAQLVPGTRDVYYVTGYCGNQLRSLAVVGPNPPAVVLLEGWARFAKKLADEGKLLGASPHDDLGSGDFHVLYTTDGGYVLIRRQISNGDGGLIGVPQSCFDLKPAAEQPMIVPPGLADLWLTYDRLYQPVWPQNRAGARGNGRPTRFSFLSTGALHAVVAHGTCTSPTECTFTFGHTTWNSTVLGPYQVTASRVIAFGPR